MDNHLVHAALQAPNNLRSVHLRCSRLASDYRRRLRRLVRQDWSIWMYRCLAVLIPWLAEPYGRTVSDSKTLLPVTVCHWVSLWLCKSTEQLTKENHFDLEVFKSIWLLYIAATREIFDHIKLCLRMLFLDPFEDIFCHSDDLVTSLWIRLINSFPSLCYQNLMPKFGDSGTKPPSAVDEAGDSTGDANPPQLEGFGGSRRWIESFVH